MDDETKIDKADLVVSRNRSLLLRKSDLVKRGLELIADLKRSPLTVSDRSKKRILFVDDDDLVVEMMVSALPSLGYDVDGIVFNKVDYQTKIRNIFNADCDVLLMNIFMPLINGIDMTRLIREKRVDVPIILHTGYARLKIAVESMRAGADDLIIKPFGLKDVDLCIEKVLEQNSLQKKERGGKPRGFTDRKLKGESYYLDSKFECLNSGYYESGELLIECNHKDGKLEGITRVYRRDGTLLAEANFKDGVLDGMSKWCDRNGEARIVDIFENGDSTNRKIYGSDGKLEQDFNPKVLPIGK
jgi:CheY-like chemotaxis protein